MKAAEVDYTTTSPSHFDLSTGEVLVQDDADWHSEDHPWIVPMGILLRSPDLFVEPDCYFYDRVDTKDWSRAQFEAFAGWVGGVIEPPDNLSRKKVTIDTFATARRLGLGPGEYAIEGEFGNYSGLFAAARLEGTQTAKLFDDWDVDDAVGYLRKIGNGSRPTKQLVMARQRKDPNNPGYMYLHERFHDIGGFSKLLELAGYPVIKLWEKPDYISWGVKFMLANDGQIPTARATDYLSLEGKGPNSSTIYEYFDSLPAFQDEVTPRFYERRDEEAAALQEQFDHLQAELAEGALPLMLFSPFAHDPKDIAFTEKVVATLYGCDQPFSRIIAALGERETAVRYAKFQVLRSLIPDMAADTKIKIVRGINMDRGFIPAIRQKYSHITPADVESEALFLGVFDYIWPMDEYKDALKLDAGYEELCQKQREARQRQRKAAKEKLQPVT